VPAAAAAALRPYVLLRTVLADEGVGAIGRFVLSGKEKLCLIRPKGDALVLETLFVAEDVYSQAEIDEAAEEAQAPKKAELDLARQLVDSLVGEFDPREQLTSEYRQDLRKMLEAKLAGQPIEEPEEVEEAPVIDLMAALKQSVAEAKKRKAPAEDGQPAAKPRAKRAAAKR
jgi:DNA end-binding protein Ku